MERWRLGWHDLTLKCMLFVASFVLLLPSVFVVRPVADQVARAMTRLLGTF